MGGALRCTGNYVHLIETGKVLPSPRILQRICDLIGFNFSLAKLILLKDKLDLYVTDLRRRLDLPEV